jgi:hypothetical protein
VLAPGGIITTPRAALAQRAAWLRVRRSFRDALNARLATGSVHAILSTFDRLPFGASCDGPAGLLPTPTALLEDTLDESSVRHQCQRHAALDEFGRLVDAIGREHNASADPSAISSDRVRLVRAAEGRHAVIFCPGERHGRRDEVSFVLTSARLKWLRAAHRSAQPDASACAASFQPCLAIALLSFSALAARPPPTLGAARLPTLQVDVRC